MPVPSPVPNDDRRRRRRRRRTMRRGARLAGALLPALLMAQCAPQCAPGAALPPTPPAAQLEPAALPPPPPPPPQRSPAEGTISWDGRSPVPVVGISSAVSLSAVQRALDAGRAVDIMGDINPWDGYAHVAGHYSTHGAIFQSGPTLHDGSVIHYNGRDFVVVGRGSARAGQNLAIRPGLTVQYSGCGNVCLVYADPVT